LATTTQPIPSAPDESAALWRYMDFTKFVALLETQALFFPRVARLHDPFEGSFPTGQTVLERALAMLPEGAVPLGATFQLSPETERAWVTLRHWALVSCWYCSEHESAAMWQLYAPTGAAVAIRSTVGRLREAIGTPPPPGDGFGGGDSFHIGRVEYIDYSSARIPSQSFGAHFFRKRRSFEHEREVRVLLMRYPIRLDMHIDHDRPLDDDGLAIPVKLATLIEDVRVAPQAPRWYAHLVASVCRRYGLAAPVSQSELDAAPLY
jgi:hypothetical protein